MQQYLAAHEAHLMWLFFACAFVVIGVAETFRPRKILSSSTLRRWGAHAVLAAASIGVEALYPIGSTAVAFLAVKNPWGLLNSAKIPLLMRCALAALALDLLRYGVHYLFHHNPLLWRIHRVHHSDRDFDLTTGVRNHPGEAIIMEAFQLAAIAILAPPPAAVIVVGIAGMGQSLLSHANVHLPESLDCFLRWFLITPDVHRVHHSERIEEQNANFGILFPWWDKLFGTWRAEPVEGHEAMRLGIEELRDGRSADVLYLLSLPFRHLPPAVPERSAAEPGRLAATAGRDAAR